MPEEKVENLQQSSNRIQYVGITLLDGRRGVFAGPEFVTKAELMLKPPSIKDVVFSEPRELVRNVEVKDESK